METESGAKIAIRGKGSVKEGKGRSDAAHTSNQEEDLHCLIMADTEDKVVKAKKLIANVIETAASIPEGQNELKRNQLRELAALNGTLRDDENQACQNCGQIGHRKYDCPEQRNFTANIICRVCGNAGHMARDCPDRQRGTDWRNNDRPGATPTGARPVAGKIGDGIDREYESLMQELTGGSGAGPQQRIEAGPGAYGDGADSNLPPWQRGATGAPAPWSKPREERDNGSNAAPWASGGRGNGSTDHYGNYGNQRGGYGGGAPPAGGSAPWAQASAAPPAQANQNYGGYDYSAYAQAAAGYASAPGAVPPGVAAYYSAGAPPPPPPPGGDAPPPPPSDVPPPPPPGM